MRSFVQSRNTLRDPPPSLHNESRFLAVICPLGGCTPPVQSLTKQNFSLLRRQLFSKMFFGGLRRTFYLHMAEQDCPAVYFKLPSAACAGIPYFLRRNYDRRKAKAPTTPFDAPQQKEKRRSYAAPPSQPVKGFRRQYAPHFYRQIAQEGTPRLSKRFFRRQPRSYNTVAPSESKRAHVPTLCRNTAVFFRIARRLFSRQHARLYAISAKLCRNLYFCERIYINNLTNFPFVI